MTKALRPALPVGSPTAGVGASARPWLAGLGALLLLAAGFALVSPSAGRATLECQRATDGTGTCTFTHGSLLWPAVVSFPVDQLVGATVDVPADAGGGLLRIRTLSGGSVVFPDGGRWDHADRLAVASRITGFVVDVDARHLREGVDGRAPALAVGALLGAALALLVERASRQRFRPRPA
jgi:hypothetical protein